MNLKLIFSIYGIYNILLGLSFVLLPGPMMEGAGVTPTGDLIGTQQIWGAALIGIGWIAWNLRAAEGNNDLLGIAKAFIVVTALPVLITIYHLTLGFSGPPVYMNILVNGLALIALFIKTK